MFVPGEQVRELLRNAVDRHVICAPFIKKGAFRALLSCIPESPSATLAVYTRWSAQEVAAGVSDLEVFDLCQARQNTTLYLVDGLHAKLFVAGEDCLVGSANVTDTALGWVYPSNIEILIEARTSDPSVFQLIERLDRFSEEATSSKRDEIRDAAEQLPKLEMPESREAPDGKRNTRKWLPNCRKPDLIYRAYGAPDLRGEIESTRNAALEDLRFLNPPPGLDKEQFHAMVRDQLKSIALFEELLRLVEKDELVNGVGRDLIESLYSEDLEDIDSNQYWSNAREWLLYFFDLRAEPHEYRIVAGSRTN